MIDDLLKEASELCEKASRAPWEAVNRYVRKKGYYRECAPNGCQGDVCSCTEVFSQQNNPKDKEQAKNNAIFIARARTLIPELCNEISKIIKETDELKEYKVPKDILKSFLDDSGIMYSCPRCGSSVLFCLEDTKYCEHCGQLLNFKN